MSAKAPNSRSPLPHCCHRTPSGRRCRLPAQAGLPISDPDSALCLHHALRRRKDHDLADLASALTGKSEGFHTAAGINRSLAELYVLLAQNRISPRRAAVLAYISHLLLRTLPAIAHEVHQESDQDAAPPTLIIDVPRPQRSQPLPQAP